MIANNPIWVFMIMFIFSQFVIGGPPTMLEQMLKSKSL